MKRKTTFLRIIGYIFIILSILLAFFIIFTILVDMNLRSRILKTNDSNDLSAYLNKYYPDRLSPAKNKTLDKNTSSTKLTNSNRKKIIEGLNNYSLGPKKPKITIVEFADFSCPYCKASFPNIREISIKYKNKVKIIFRDLPIIHDYSVLLALAGRCAGEQGKFWLMHDKLFMNANINNRNKINTLAGNINLNMGKFNSCMDSQKYLNNIKKDISDAQMLGIDNLGTPIFFINNKQISGAIPRDNLNKIIESLLKSQNNAIKK